MKFYRIPDARTPGGATPEMIADLKSTKIIPGNIGAFASEQDWISQTQVGAPSDGLGPKFWRDNATIYGVYRETYDYLTIGRNQDGSITKLDLRTPNGFSDETWFHYSPSTARFYRQYLQHFPLIPTLTRRTLSRYDARRMNFTAKPGSTTPAEDYPLGIFLGDPSSDNRVPSFPSNMALRFNPQTGITEAFYWEEYVREFPFDWTPTVPAMGGSGPKLSDQELVATVQFILTGQESIAAKASAIRQVAAQ